MESVKTDLALKHDFNVHDAFHLFDVQELGCITHYDLADGLKLNLQFGQFCDEDIAMLMHRFDRKQLNRITFRSFCEQILPFSPEYAGRAYDRP